MPRIVILYNEPTVPADHPAVDAEHQIYYTAGEIENALKGGGYEVFKLGANVNPGKIVNGIRELAPDAVFNLFEGVVEFGETEAFAAGLLEWLGVPYTGCPCRSLMLCQDKVLTKRLLKSAKLPTPKFHLIEQWPPRANRMGWPVIVKPANQDSSVGVDQGAVVTNAVEYRQRVEYVKETFGWPVLVEQFIAGREFNVPLYEAPELTMLPPIEYEFLPGNRWGIITYEAKWRPDTVDNDNTPPNYTPTIDPDIRADLEQMAKEAYRLLGCRDLARVDFRVTPGGEPFIIEVNPNPDFSDEGGLGDCLAVAGLSQKQLAIRMVENALARGAKKLVEPVGIEVIPWDVP
jgi:D-alanine-D-alanine ligase